MSATQHLSPVSAVTGRIPRAVALLLAGTLTVFASMLVAPPAHAAPVGPDANGISYETDPSTHTATVTGYTQVGVITDVVIPGTINDGGETYTITSIGGDAFNTTGLTSVAIPSSVTHIGEDAFAGNSLASVTLPTALTFLGDYAFRSNQLTALEIPSAVTHIGNYAFANNSLSSVDLGDSLISIGNSAFADNALTTVIIPGSVTTMYNFAFFNNPGLNVAVFQGPPPSTFTANGSTGSLGNTASLTVYYPSQFASSYDPTNTGSWEGYTAAAGATLNYDLGGHGTAIDSVTVIPGTAVPAAAAPPADPTEPGYTFEDWYTTSTGTTPFDFTAPLTGDTTAYAGWNALPATVTFNLGGHGTAIAPITAVSGATITPPADPTEPGYTFTGWYTTAAGTTLYDFTALPAGDTTAFAQWAAVTTAILPVTGTNLAPMAGTGILALLLGGVVLAWTRRYNHSTNV